MASFNKVMLMGNLTRDVELRYTPNGNQAVANFGIACNRKFKTQSGEEREEVTFVDCEAWGRTGEVMKEYLSKGRPVFIEGRLKLDQWEDKEGKKQSKLRVVVENFQFIDSKGGGGGGGGGERATGSRGNQASQQAHQEVAEADIPF
jgi:single-strand DNA-binding protein